MLTTFAKPKYKDLFILFVLRAVMFAGKSERKIESRQVNKLLNLSSLLYTRKSLTIASVARIPGQELFWSFMF